MSNSRHIIDLFDDMLDELTGQVEKSGGQARLGSAALRRALKEGNLNAFFKNLKQFEEQMAGLTGLVGEMSQAWEKFSASEMSLDGYARSFEDACKERGVFLEGEFPNYVVFPFEVKFQIDRQIVLVNGKSVNLLRPAVLAEHIKKVYERVHGASFNEKRFRRALLKAYDLINVEGKPGYSASLRKIHETLSLREGPAYPIRAFAFDIYRLRRIDLQEDGRRLVFVPGRFSRSSIVVPASHGETENLSALQVVKEV